MIRALLASMLVAALLPGCGAEVGAPYYDIPAIPVFMGWKSLSSSACVGELENGGMHAATGVRVNVYYMTAAGESLVVVTPALDRLEGNGRTTTFTVPPQVTNGEARFPRCGSVVWNGGISPGEGWKPSYSLFGWCPMTADSARCYVVVNHGAYAGYGYHIVARFEGRDGVVNRSAVPDHIGGHDMPIFITSTTRDSAGILLPPKFVALTWENYGGVADSMVIADLYYGAVGLGSCP